MTGTTRPSTYVLPNALVPYPDESLMGLLMRNAAQYRFNAPMRLFRRLRPPSVVPWTFCQEAPDGSMGKAMATLLGLDDHVFRRMSMWTGDVTTLAVLGQPVWSELVRHLSRAACPSCMREAPYHRAAWLLNAIPVCPGHAVHLRHRCHGCGGLLRWYGNDVCRCGNTRCKADVRDAPEEPADAVSLAASAALVDLVRTGGGAPLGMPVYQAYHLSFVLGRAALGFTRKMRPPGFIERELRRIHELMDVGWRALDDWPNGFRGFLDQVRARAPARKGNYGLKRAFGDVAPLVWAAARESWGAPVGAAFAEYCAALPELRTSARRLSGYAAGAGFQREYMSITEAKTSLGLSPATTAKLLEGRDLYAVKPAGAGPAASIRVEDVERLREEMATFLLPEQARKLLGVGRAVMDQLVEAGLVNRVPEGERFMESMPFRRSDIVAFMEACIGDGPVVSVSAMRQRNLTSLRNATPRFPVADVCRALVEGRLKAVARRKGAPGLSQVCLRMADVGELFQDELETMSIVAAADALGIKYTFLHHWAERGFLGTTTSRRRGERGLRVTSEGLARFRSEYVTPPELGLLLGGKSSRWHSHHLLFQGVQPVSGPSVDGSAMLLFRRSDCTPEVVDAIRRLRRPKGAAPAERRREAFARTAKVAGIIATRWGTCLSNAYNLFRDEVGGRSVQIVVGRRPDRTGIFRFKIGFPTLARLRTMQRTWIALVPDVGNAFLLVPLDHVHWRENGYVSVSFNADGNPLEMTEWAVPV